MQPRTNHLGHVALVAHLLPLLRTGSARVISQVSVAANQGAINWQDLNYERSCDGMNAYSQSKIAFGLFGLELDRRSRAEGWGITSNLSRPGIAPTNLLAARPEVGRAHQTMGRRIIGALSSRGILVGTVETAGLPALYAATSPKARGARFYGPGGPGHFGGPPAEQQLYSRLRSGEDARRMWHLSEELTTVSVTAPGRTTCGTPGLASSRRSTSAGAASAPRAHGDLDADRRCRVVEHPTVDTAQDLTACNTNATECER